MAVRDTKTQRKREGGGERERDLCWKQSFSRDHLKAEQSQDRCISLALRLETFCPSRRSREIVFIYLGCAARDTLNPNFQASDLNPTTTSNQFSRDFSIVLRDERHLTLTWNYSVTRNAHPAFGQIERRQRAGRVKTMNLK